MFKKIVLFFVLLLLSFFVIYFFLFNDSYKKSFQARVYYAMGKYKMAYDVAKEAYLSDPYNRMALTMLNASNASLKYLKYIQESKEYLEKIEKISAKSKITPAELAKIKLICEVMIGEYKKLKPIVISDGDLVQRATNQYNKFKKIYEELFKK